MPRKLGLLVATILLFNSPLLQATDYYWNATSGDWSTATNWGGIEPTHSDSAYISNGGTATVFQSGEKCYSLYLGEGTGTSGTIEMLGGGLSSAQYEYIGYSGTGIFTQTGGTNTIPLSLYLGYGSDAIGTYDLSGTGQLSAQFELIGYSGTGTLTQIGGTNTISRDLCLGLNSGTTGVYDLRGMAQLSALNEYIGSSGTGTLTQTGGTNTISRDLYLGNNSGAIGTYNLSGSGQLSAKNEYIGYQGTGTFTQMGGINTVLYLHINIRGGAASTYDLSGSGQLSAVAEYVDHGSFTQTGGINTISSHLDIGNTSGCTGMYNLSDTGQLFAVSERIGDGGEGIFTQTGGTNTISSALLVGFYFGGTGTYNLSGTGQLLANIEEIGASGIGIGKFMQTSGINAVTYLKINMGGKYTLSRGALNVNGGYENQGTLDLQGSSALINMSSSIIAMQAGSILTSTGSNTTLNIDSHSLLIVRAGFNLLQYFTIINNTGLIHQIGSALNIPSDRSIYGVGSITDHVNCDGTFAATTGHFINLNDGLNIGETGIVNLGTGTLYVNDANSGMNSGSLNAALHYVGSTGTGSFTQSGGINTVSSSFCLGKNSADTGTYNLSGTGQLSAVDEYIGYSGTGTFTQTGGINTISRDLELGENSGATGTYNLSGSGRLSAKNEYMGYSGTGTFTQTGGINTISSDLCLGYNSYSTGTYNLNGGTLILKSLTKGSGTATFNFGGGTLQASGSLTTALSMKLTEIGGNANIDTAGFAVTCSGILSGTGGLNKLGSGTLTLSGNNTFAGPVNFNGGFINTSALNRFGKGTTLNFNGGGLQFAGAFDPSVRTMSFLAAGSTLDTQANNIALANPIGNNGPGNLTKLGSGKLSLNALNTYSGNTIVKGGTLEIAGGIPALGTSLIDVQSGKAIVKTTTISKPDLDISTAAAATFEVLNGIHSIDAISGSGTTQVDAGAVLNVASIVQNKITIAAGGKLVIRPIAASASNAELKSVPEPSSVILLACAFILLLCGWIRKR